jgi:hypothetical protein
MQRIGLVLLVVTGAAEAPAQNAAAPSELIDQARERMQLVMGSQPNYTCLETIERTRRTVDVSYEIEDTLRLEVALADGTEMFAWPGSKEFESKELTDLLVAGLFGNGNFGIYTRMLFGGSGPQFEYAGEAQVRGRAVMRFT